MIFLHYYYLPSENTKEYQEMHNMISFTHRSFSSCLFSLSADSFFLLNAVRVSLQADRIEN